MKMNWRTYQRVTCTRDHLRDLLAVLGTMGLWVLLVLGVGILVGA